MCITHVKTYVYPNGGRETVERLEYCNRSDGSNPCRLHTRRKYPEQPMASSSTVASPSLVDDDVTTPSSGSFPSTPPSVTSGPRTEIRGPSGSSGKGKAKRTINPQDYRLQFSNGKKENRRRTDETLPRAHFADDEKSVIGGSDAAARPVTPFPRRGRGEAPSPSILRSPAPTGLGSPVSPRLRHTPTEVHQPNPPSPSRDDVPRLRHPIPSGHRRTLTEPTVVNMFSSSRAENIDADVYTRPDYRARARENHQRQERERRREAEDDRRRQEQTEAERLQEIRDRAEDEHSLREYIRINAREEMRNARRRTSPDADQWENLEERVRALQPREQGEQEQVERIAREIRERRERIRDDVRREAEAETRTRDQNRHDAERRMDRRLQEAISHMPRRPTEDELPTTEEIRRLANRIELERAALRQREREDELRERRRTELRRIDALEEEIRHLETELRQPPAADTQNFPDRRAEQQQQQQQRNSWNDSHYSNYYDPRYYYQPVIGQPYIPPSTPSPYPSGWPSSGGSSGAIPSHSPYEDPNYRRARGQRVLQQERAFANARDRAIEMHQAVNNDVAVMPTGLHRRNTLSGSGREREMGHRRPTSYYPWWGP